MFLNSAYASEQYVNLTVTHYCLYVFICQDSLYCVCSSSHNSVKSRSQRKTNVLSCSFGETFYVRILHIHFYLMLCKYKYKSTQSLESLYAFLSLSFLCFLVLCDSSRKQLWRTFPWNLLVINKLNLNWCNHLMANSQDTRPTAVKHDCLDTTTAHQEKLEVGNHWHGQQSLSNVWVSWY